MTPDRSAAAAYVTALTGSADTPLTWQLLSDDKRGRHYAQDYHARLDEIWRELAYQNSRGIGIFAMVSAGDGAGRRAGNVVGLRALFVDDDGGRLPPGDKGLELLPPSFSVRSKRGFHHYWALQPGAPLSAFSPAQSALAAHFQTDPAVKDLPRVMRVPGLLHMKDPGAPFLVEFLPGTGRRHTVPEVLSAYPAPLPTPSGRAASPPVAGLAPRHIPSGKGMAVALLEAFRGLRLVRWAMAHPADVTREAWRGIATNLAAAVLDSQDLHEAAAALFREISEPDQERYSPVACDRAFRDALKSARDFGPMTFATLEVSGVPRAVCDGSRIAKAPVGVARILAARAKQAA